MITTVFSNVNFKNHYTNNKITYRNKLIDFLYYYKSKINSSFIIHNDTLVNSIKSKKTIRYDSKLRLNKLSLAVLEDNCFIKRDFKKTKNNYIIKRNALEINEKLINYLIYKIDKLNDLEIKEAIKLAKEFNNNISLNTDDFIYICNSYIFEKLYTSLDLIRARKSVFKAKLQKYFYRKYRYKNADDFIASKNTVLFDLADYIKNDLRFNNSLLEKERKSQIINALFNKVKA